MRRWLMICAFGGLLLSGCYEGPAPELPRRTIDPSLGDPHAGMSSMEGRTGSAAAQPLG